MRGEIKNWNDDRGFGFIAPESGGEDIFVHARQLPEGYLSLARGVSVEFETFMADGGRMQGRVLSVGDFPARVDPGESPQPDVGARPRRPGRAQAAPVRERIWTADRRTELAEQAAAILLADDVSETRIDAMRLLLEAVNDDAR